MSEIKISKHFYLARFAALHCIAAGLTFCMLFVFLYQVFSAGGYTEDVIALLLTKGGWSSLRIVLVMYALPAYGAYSLWKREREFPVRPFLLFYVAWAALLCWFYLSSVQPEYVSDFLRMWEAANRFATEGLHPARGIIEQRAFFVLYPIVKLLGGSHLALGIANAAIYVAIGLIGYDLLRRQQGHRVGQAFALVWLTSFEPIMSTGIPTHDLWGVLFIATSLWAFVRAQGEIAISGWGWRTLLWVIATGVSLAVLQAQREIGIILLLAMCLVWGYAGLAKGRSASETLAGPLVLVVIFFVSGMALSQVGVVAPTTGQEKLDTARTAGFSTSFSSGRFAYGVAVRDTFLAPLNDDVSRKSLARSIFLSDVTNQPSDRPINVLKRLSMLASPGAQTYFYMSGVPRPKVQHARAASAISAFLVFGLGIFAVFAILRRDRGRMLSSTAVLTIFAGGTIIAFCLVMEVQPRYAFFMWFVASALIADGLFGDGTSDEVAAPEFREVLFPRMHGKIGRALGSMPAHVATVAALGCLGWAVLDLAYSPDRGRIISGWEYAITQQEGALPSAGKALVEIQDQPTGAFSHLGLPPDQASSFGQLATTLEFPAMVSEDDSVSARRIVCTQQHDALSFYVSTPYKHMPRSGAFELYLLQDGDRLWSMKLPAADRPLAARVPLVGGGGCSTIEFKLVSHVAMKVESWRRASRVEIIFPRLVDSD